MKKFFKIIFYICVILGGLCVISFATLYLLFIFSIGSAKKETTEANKFAAHYEPIFASTTAQAIATKNPQLCTSLLHYRYYHSIDWGCDSCRVRTYQNECVTQYLREYPDESHCSLMTNFTEEEKNRTWGYNTSFNIESCPSEVAKLQFAKTLDPHYCDKLHTLSKQGYGDSCFTHLAEVKNDISWCEKTKSPDARAHCRAYVNKDPWECYVLSKDAHDVSRYSRGVGFCIGDIVERTADYRSCLLIDSLDYGKQWEILRDECLETAASLYKRGTPERKKICDAMVDIREEYWPYNYKESCYTTLHLLDHPSTLPPRLFWY